MRRDKSGYTAMIGVKNRSYRSLFSFPKSSQHPSHQDLVGNGGVDISSLRKCRDIHISVGSFTRGLLSFITLGY